MSDARIAKIRELQRLNEDLQAQVAVLRGALETLVKKYIKNKGTEYQFVACMTPQGTPDFWENAINALSTTPAEAAERVQKLVGALERILAQRMDLGGEIIPTEEAVWAMSALAQWRCGRV